MLPGTVVGDFRIERLIGTGSVGAVYEATQLSLSRRVALRVISEEHFADTSRAEEFRKDQNRAATFQHPRVVPVYEVGDWQGGKFVASRLVRGRTLAEYVAAEHVPPDELEAILEPIAAALDSAHAAGIVHGGVNGRNVLVGAAGTAHLTDFGLGRAGTCAGDLEALDSLYELASSRSRRRSASPSPKMWLGVALVIVATTGVALVLATGPGEGERPGGTGRTIGCAENPGPNTPACTLSQSTGSGEPFTVGRAGVITSWRVTGATGDLTLQIIRGDDDGPFVTGFSQPVRPADDGPQEFPAQVSVAPGDRIGVLLGPGATIGLKAGGSDASVVRWSGALAPDPNDHGFERIDGEIQLDVEIEEGARLTQPAQLKGRAAAEAEGGRVLGSRFVDLKNGKTVRVDLVQIEASLVLDAFRDGRRLARMDVPDIRPGGELLNLDEFAYCGDRQGLCLRWVDEGETTPVVHAYRFTGEAFRLIG